MTHRDLFFAIVRGRRPGRRQLPCAVAAAGSPAPSRAASPSRIVAVSFIIVPSASISRPRSLIVFGVPSTVVMVRPLGDCGIAAKGVVMNNLIGDDVHDWAQILSDPANHLHLYGKAAARPGRKMGHVTRLIL